MLINAVLRTFKEGKAKVQEIRGASLAGCEGHKTWHISKGGRGRI